MLPPVSRLTPAQAMYHFISGYTAKVAGTEMGVTEPQATFSPCFGGPFLVWHPTKYAELLADEDAASTAPTSGWSTPAGRGGGYGVGKRMKLSITRAIIDAIHSGQLADVATTPDPVFGVGVPQSVPGVDAKVLTPKLTWADAAAYDATAKKLANLFVTNFKQYEAVRSAEVRAAGPKA